MIRTSLAASTALVCILGVAQAQPAPPQPQPASSPRSFGAPLTMQLPDDVRVAQRDEGIAVTRLALLFDQKQNRDGIKVQFEDMVTEVPIIYAAFEGKRCDQELSYETWLGREGRGVDLTFVVKTLPGNLDGVEVALDHLHYQGKAESRLSRFKAPDVEIGKPYSVRLRGSKPGINRYRLHVSYKGADGKAVEQAGFSHWVIVQAPPAFEFTPDASCNATWRQAGELTMIEADTLISTSFLLHQGLDPKNCMLRVSRRGKREIDLSQLSPEVRRVVGAFKQAQGWLETHRVRLDEAGKAGLKVSREEGFVKVALRHSLSATSAVLPLSDMWEYRFELLHGNASQVLATWFGGVELKISNAAAIKAAQVKLTWTGRSDALKVALVEKK